MKQWQLLLFLAGTPTLMASGAVYFSTSSAERIGDLPTEKAVLTAPPQVPPVIERSHPAKVVVELEVIEKVMKMADGVDYPFWTFGGTVPGSFIRVRAGDTVEFHLLNNPQNKIPHNIDLHAVTGPGGGATSSFTAPGHKSRFTFQALNPGLYIYHCATAPVGMHIGNGMYGLIYVQPSTPLPKVDHEYYVVQGDFYTSKPFGTKGLQQFSMENAIDEKPTYVVFNGSTTSLTGDNALKAKVGESIRLFVGNGGPNLVSSFHVIGAIFDKVYAEGGVKASQENVGTTLVPSGGSAIVEYKVQVPGTYVIVDHSIFRTFNKGSLGMMKVEGPENKAVYSGKETDEIYDPTALPQLGKSPETNPSQVAATNPHPLDGKDIFEKNCAMCHQAQGQGLEGVFPPLAKSDFLKRITDRTNRQEWLHLILTGKQGKITVNGKEYNGSMTPAGAGLSDEELATLMTFVANSWGNKARPFTPEEIKKYRGAIQNKSSARASEASL
ncbi:MAG: copper-containing nitrite reductase [Bdellovibrionota bacterium]